MHLALVGPTASGKSAIALAAAHALGDVEIVSIDSMQVYRGLDVGTAKPSPDEQAAVPHHLVDVAEPEEDWSVARFQRAARAAIADIAARGKRALLVGGTGLYVRAVVDPLEFPPRDLELRARLEAEARDPVGLAAAYRELRRLDPDAAARIEPGNRRRIVRALEVIRITGRPFSSFGPGLHRFPAPVVDVAMAGIWLPRAVLGQRVADRVAVMFDSGLVDEARALDHRGAPARTARQAIGYAEALALLRGELSFDEARVAVGDRTRAFARRQRMWFRRDPRVTWVAVSRNPCQALPALLARWSA